MRLDGRQAGELRPVTIVPGYTDYAEGSVLISMGKTRVLCNATLESGVPRWMYVQGKSSGWVTAEYAMLPRATHQRTPREGASGGGRSMEIRRLIGRSLRAAVDLEKLGQRTCIVDCDVLQADGGTRTAAITGGYVALALALRHLEQDPANGGSPLRGPIAAISAGIVAGVPLLDLCYEEDSRAEVDLNVVMNATGNFVELQGTAEGPPFPRAALDQLLGLAQEGIQQLLAIQKAALDGII